MSFAEETERRLREAGWFPGRVADTGEAVAALRAAGYANAERALAMVAPYMGLAIYFANILVPGRRDYIWFNPILSEQDIFPETVASWAARVGRPLCPIGEAFGGYMTVTIDERGHVFAGLDSTLIFLGISVEDCIDRLCRGLPTPDVP